MVTHDDVRNIASLARLAVTPDRLDELVAELNAILAHMDALRAVDATPVDLRDGPGATSATEGMRLADDRGPSVALTRAPSTFAPEWRDGFFLVPRLASHGDAGAVEGDGA